MRSSWWSFPDTPASGSPGRLRGRDPEQVAIGMTVEIGFEPGPGDIAVAELSGHGCERGGMSTDAFERRAVISGIGQSAIGRQVDRSGLQLTLDAILAAIDDAGLTVDDIDGLAMFPGGGVANLPGYANGNLYEVQDALRIEHHLAAGAGRGNGPAVLRSGAGRRHRAGPACRHLAHRQGGQRGAQRRWPARLRLHQTAGRGPAGVAAADRDAVTGLSDRALRDPVHARIRRSPARNWRGFRSLSAPMPHSTRMRCTASR